MTREEMGKALWDLFNETNPMLTTWEDSQNQEVYCTAAERFAAWLTAHRDDTPPYYFARTEDIPPDIKPGSFYSVKK